MRLEIKKCLQDVLLAAQDIEDFLSGLDYAQYASSSMIQAAVERKIEIIGEALNRISRLDESIVSKLHQYKRIIGFRNVIAHGYDIVDPELVWDAVENHLPSLKPT
jgi:uncharacterized protein with HEPN domain